MNELQRQIHEASCQYILLLAAETETRYRAATVKEIISLRTSGHFDLANKLSELVNQCDAKSFCGGTLAIQALARELGVKPVAQVRQTWGILHPPDVWIRMQAADYPASSAAQVFGPTTPSGTSP